MTVRMAAILLLALSMAGCGVRGFKKDGATQEDFDQDIRTCEFESNRGYNGCIRGTGSCGSKKARNTCMVLKGWELTRDPGKFVITR
jgi:hypothetical protein